LYLKDGTLHLQQYIFGLMQPTSHLKHFARPFPAAGEGAAGECYTGT
jgi:hypothetical protein